MKKVYLVNLFVGRLRLGIAIDPKWIGFDLEAKGMENVKHLFDEHVDLGHFHVLPKSRMKELVNFESKARMSFRRFSIDFNFGSQMYWQTEDMVKEFEVEFKKLEKEYHDLLEGILVDYDKIVDNFIDLFSKAFKGKKKKQFIQEMKGKIPFKKDYIDSFEISFKAKSFIVQEDDEIVDRFLGKGLQIAFEQVKMIDKAIAKISKGTIKEMGARTIGSISNSLNEINRLNLRDDKRIMDIIENFRHIKALKGTGPNSLRTLKNIKSEIHALVHELEVADMIKW
jgi:hypothetical protein